MSAPVAHFTTFTVIATGGATGTDAGTDSGSDATTGGNCAFKGTFNLEKYLCGTADVTSSWKSVIPTEVLVVTDCLPRASSRRMTLLARSATG